MTESEIIAELTWNVLPSELLDEATKIIKKLVAERDEARASLAYVQAETDRMYRRVVELEGKIAGRE